MIAKNIIFGLTLGGVAYYVYDAMQPPPVDSLDTSAGGFTSVLDGFMNVGYAIGSGAGMGLGMGISLNGLNQLKLSEGRRLNVYNDTSGYPTIGYGHKLTALENYTTIDEATATKLLSQDVATAENGINSLVKVPLNQNQFDALCSFVYNVGVGAFGRSTMLKYINSGDYQNAALQFGVWNKRKLASVAARRDREMQLFTA